MKKAFFLIAAMLLLCGGMKAQEMAVATPSDLSTELTLANALPTSLYSAPTLDYAGMPTADFNTNRQFGTEQYSSSRKGWGIALIISGGLTMMSGLSAWLFSDMFSNMTSTIPDEEVDPEFQQTADAVSKTIKTAGIVGTILGAGEVAGGILLISSDKKSGSKSGKKRSSSKRYKHRRYSENLLAPEDYSNGWALTLNPGLTNSALTLTF
ncbi:MAG: hypothetical protein J5641_03875 [Bacteroidales bacterium]|nr:hypothetical protein [Bacteroidales bacterium]